MLEGMNRLSALKFTMLSVTAVVPLTLAWSTARTHHTFLVLSHYFHGRTGTCSFTESFQGEALSRTQHRNSDEIRAASRVIKADGPYQLWATPGGEYWVPKRSGDDFLYDLGEQKRNIYGTNMKPGDIVLDAGANVGVFTRKALAAGAAKIIAIEPGPENVACLRRTFPAEIAAGKVVVYPKGIWDKADVLKLAVDPDNSARDSFVRPIGNAQYIEVPLVTTDQLVAELQLPRVDFIKMDIEGAERNAVAGARATIAKFHPRMALCIYHLKDDPKVVPQLVHDIDANYRSHQTCLCASDRVQPEVAFFE